MRSSSTEPAEESPGALRPRRTVSKLLMKDGHLTVGVLPPPTRKLRHMDRVPDCLAPMAANSPLALPTSPMSTWATSLLTLGAIPKTQVVPGATFAMIPPLPTADPLSTAVMPPASSKPPRDINAASARLEQRHRREPAATRRMIFIGDPRRYERVDGNCFHPATPSRHPLYSRPEQMLTAIAKKNQSSAIFTAFS